MGVSTCLSIHPIIPNYLNMPTPASSSPPQNPTRRRSPRIPLELIDRAYSFFDPIESVADRAALSASTSTSKAVHALVLPRLYQTLRLASLVGGCLDWRGLTRAQMRADLPYEPRNLPSAAVKHCKHLIVTPHQRHDENETSPLKIDLPALELTTFVVEIKNHTWTNDWHNGCRRQLVFHHQPDCDFLTHLRPKTILIDLPHPGLIGDAIYGDPSGKEIRSTPIPEEMLSPAERLVIRPAALIEEDDISDPTKLMALTINVGPLGKSIKNLDIILEPGREYLRKTSARPTVRTGWLTPGIFGQIGSGSAPLTVRQELFIESLAAFMFAPHISSGCTVNIVGAGYLTSLLDQPPKSILEVQERIEKLTKEKAISKRGDNKATREVMARLKFVDLKDYALELKGVHRTIVSESTWNIWENGGDGGSLVDATER